MKKYVATITTSILSMYPAIAFGDYPLWASSYIATHSKASEDGYDAPGYGSDDSPHWFLPRGWTSHRELLRSMWVVPFILLCLWFLTSLFQYGLQYFMQRRGGARREELRGLLQGEESEGTAAEGSDLLDRLAKATRALRTAFIMSIATAAVASLPVAYDCPIGKPPTRSPVPLPPKGRCGTCFANGVNLATVILQWVFLGLTILWSLLEMITIDIASVSIIRSILGLAAFPLIAVIYIIVFMQWKGIGQREADAQCQ
ncbi:hypothetical protein SeMB42_g07374 [Synchytrium endobioticum]|nr:hypothetical protein SeMB42_g07374 [Synchytrium endobioticum]